MDTGKAREAFAALDHGTGELPLRQIRAALQRLDIYPSEERLFEEISRADPAGSGFLTLESFISLSNRCQEQTRPDTMDVTTVDAFVALGGNRDRSGTVSTERLRQAILEEFALPIDIDRLIKEADTDGSGFVDFEEFAAVLRSE